MTTSLFLSQSQKRKINLCYNSRRVHQNAKESSSKGVKFVEAQKNFGRGSHSSVKTGVTPKIWTFFEASSATGSNWEFLFPFLRNWRTAQGHRLSDPAWQVLRPVFLTTAPYCLQPPARRGSGEGRAPQGLCQRGPRKRRAGLEVGAGPG